jgi:hypothetical protein
VSSPPPSLEDGNRSSFRNVVFSRIPDDGKVQNPVILCIMHHRQNPLESIQYIQLPRYSNKRVQTNYGMYQHSRCCCRLLYRTFSEISNTSPKERKIELYEFRTCWETWNQIIFQSSYLQSCHVVECRVDAYNLKGYPMSRASSLTNYSPESQKRLLRCTQAQIVPLLLPSFSL